MWPLLESLLGLFWALLLFFGVLFLGPFWVFLGSFLGLFRGFFGSRARRGPGGEPFGTQRTPIRDPAGTRLGLGGDPAADPAASQHGPGGDPAESQTGEPQISTRVFWHC